MNERRQTRDAVLEMALEERLGAAPPPDLWPRIQARQRQRSQRRRLRALSLSRCAAAVACVGVIVTVYASRADQGTQGPKASTYRADAPRSIEELRGWVRAFGVHEATVMTRSVRIDATADDISLRPVPLEGLFSGIKPSFDLSESMERMLESELLTAPPAPGSDIGPAQHVIRATCGEHRFEVRVRGAGTIPRLGSAEAPSHMEFAIALRDQLAPLVFGRSLRESLAPELADVTERMMQIRGLAVTPGGLRSLDRSKTKRVTPYRLGVDVVEDLASFDRLSTLDLRESPDLHAAELFERLTGLGQLRTLIVDGSQLNSADLNAIGKLNQLAELFFYEREVDWLDHVTGSAGGRAGSCVTDANLHSLTPLKNLRELSIPGANITDAGLRALSTLKNLRNLDLRNAAKLGPGSAGTINRLDLKSVCLSGTRVPLDALDAEISRIQVDAATLFAAELPVQHRSRNPSERRGWLGLNATGSDFDSDGWSALLAQIVTSGRFSDVSILNASFGDAALLALPQSTQSIDLGFANCPNISNEALSAVNARPGYDCYRVDRERW